MQSRRESQAARSPRADRATTAVKLLSNVECYDYQHIEDDDVSLVQRNLSIGPFSNGGAGIGYSISRRLVPQLYVALVYGETTYEAKYDGERDYDKADMLKYEVRPSLEIALLPESRFVPFVVVGAAVGGSSVTISDETIRAVGTGGSLSVGLHAFIVPQASADVSFTYRLLGMVDDDRDSQLEDARNLLHGLFLNVGVSFWL